MSAAITAIQDFKSSESGRLSHRPLNRRMTWAALATFLAIGLAIMPLQPQSALAFSSGNCPTTGLDNWDTIRVDAGKVDLGDQAYLPTTLDFSNYEPHGDAIVCWYADKRKVWFKGVLWNDHFNGQVRAVVTSYRGTGSNPIAVTANVISHTDPVLGNGGNTPAKTIDYSVTVTTNDLYRLRVSLETRASGTGSWKVVSVHNRYWGL